MNAKHAGTVAVLSLLSTPVFADDSNVSGTWKAKIEGQMGMATEIVIVLKQDGADISGTLAAGQMPPSSITHGKNWGEVITFRLPYTPGPAGGMGRGGMGGGMPMGGGGMGGGMPMGGGGMGGGMPMGGGGMGGGMPMGGGGMGGGMPMGGGGMGGGMPMGGGGMGPGMGMGAMGPTPGQSSTIYYLGKISKASGDRIEFESSVPGQPGSAPMVTSFHAKRTKD